MLASRIIDFVRGEGDRDFDSLAAEAFALHFEKSPPFRRLAEAAAVTPETIGSWRDIPMIPTLAFKTQTLAIDEPREVFRSSGTTNPTPSVHHHPYPDLYRAVIDATFPQALLDGLDSPPMLSLVPSRELAPDSSLAFMLDHAMERWGGPGSQSVIGPAGIRATDVRGFLAARQRDGRPSLVLSTAFSLVQFLDVLDRLKLSFRLPQGSRIFETGGYKGRSRELSRDQMIGLVQERLGVGSAMVIREYGMTELTSHFYSHSQSDLKDRFTPPAWVRFRVLDPATLEEATPGEPGLLAVCDLANVGSALHVLTEDLAIENEGAFRLVGRASGAELRGCSLLSEELAG